MAHGSTWQKYFPSTRRYLDTEDFVSVVTYCDEELCPGTCVRRSMYHSSCHSYFSVHTLCANKTKIRFICDTEVPAHLCQCSSVKLVHGFLQRLVHIVGFGVVLVWSECVQRGASVWDEHGWCGASVG